MSTHRCEHGRVVYDTVGEYRCYECEPVGPYDLEVLRKENLALEAENDELRDSLRELVARVKQLESRSAMDLIDEKGLG
jgi:hypothetical protein